MSRVEGYDKGYHIMNAHELVMRISDTSCLWTTKELSTLEAALRSAVIREASIGQVFFTTDERPVAIGAKELKVGGRTFDLILKETSGERPY